MRILISGLCVLLLCPGLRAQVNVTTLVELNASGGVTYGPDGMLYVSDFGTSSYIFIARLR